MNYSKPELWVLGEAGTLILSKKPLNVSIDANGDEYTANPAYELDE
jgi:hypothetical protein